jgi:hypothetical protein
MVASKSICVEYPDNIGNIVLALHGQKDFEIAIVSVFLISVVIRVI